VLYFVRVPLVLAHAAGGTCTTAFWPVIPVGDYGWIRALPILQITYASIPTVQPVAVLFVLLPIITAYGCRSIMLYIDFRIPVPSHSSGAFSLTYGRVYVAIHSTWVTYYRYIYTFYDFFDYLRLTTLSLSPLPEVWCLYVCTALYTCSSVSLR